MPLGQDRQGGTNGSFNPGRCSTAPEGGAGKAELCRSSRLRGVEKLIEDGSIAVLFWLLTLGSAAWDRFDGGADGWFERAAVTPYVVGSLAATSFEGRAEGAEARLSVYPGQAYGPVRPVLDLSVTERGGAFAGVGLAWQRDVDLGQLPLFVGVEFIPGLWLDGDGPDLGGAFQVRSGVELGVRLEQWGDARISVMLDHRSNGDLERINPGIESVSLRFHMPF